MRVDTTEMPTVEMRSDGTLNAALARTGGIGDRPLSVIVLDDNSEVSSMLAATLREAGYVVTEAIGPGQARDLVAASPFDVALIDLVMPDANGVDVLQELRGLAFGAGMAAVVLNVLPTGSARDTVVDCVTHLGNAEVLDKPVTPTTLLAALRRLVSKSA